MTRERGFTLYELMVTVAVVGTVSLAFAASASGIHRENAVSRAYCADVHGMRTAARLLRADLRSAASVNDLDWRRDGDRLFRGTREIARNVRGFTVKADGTWVTARIVVGDGAEVGVRTRMRNAGRKR